MYTQAAKGPRAALPGAVVLAVAVGLCLQAQSPRAEAQGATARDGGLEEVIVRARKRDESLQDVPISISVIPDVVLERRNVTSLDDVAQLSPSLLVDTGSTPTGSRIVVRGLSPQRGRPNTAILVDGIDTTTEAITYVGAGMLAMERLLDLERIEVVKGPQSALYGRSAFNGAIQYITRNPSDEPEARLSANISEHDDYDVSGSLSGPIVAGKLAWRVNANYWSERGYYREQATNSYVGGGEGSGIALSLRATPTESFTARARFEYVDSEYDQPAVAAVGHNVITAPPVEGTEAGVYGSTVNNYYFGQAPDGEALSVVLSPNPRTGAPYPGVESQVARASLILDWDAGPGKVSSWTGHVDAKDRVFQDGERDALLAGPPGQQLNVGQQGSEYNFRDTTEQFSQELRFSSDFEGNVQFSIGALYWTESAEFISANAGVNCTPRSCDDRTVSSILGDPGFSVTPRLAAARDIDHVSGYGLVEWQFAPTFTLTAEARYSHEDEEVQGLHCTLPTVDGAPCSDPYDPGRSIHGPSTLLRNFQDVAPGVLISSKTSDDFTTPRLTLQWEPRAESMFYVSAAKAVKPGGTTTVTAGTWLDSRSDFDVSDYIYGPETLWNYEVGGKLTWLERRLITNVAVFKQEYEDKQVTSLIVTPSGLNATRILNAGEARVWGAEVDMVYAPTPRWRMNLGYTYLDTRYVDFDIVSTSATEAARNGSCTPVTIGTDVACYSSLAGRQLENAPKHAALAGVGYTAPLGGAGSLFGAETSWFAEVDGRFQGKRFLDASNRQWLDDFWLANVRVGLTNERWEVSLYMNNAFDDRTIRSAQAQGNNVDKHRTNPNSNSSSWVMQASLPDPRTVGLSARFRF